MVSIPYEKITLANGLDVVMHEDHSLPVVSINVWYHVGSKDEESGRTGFAHLFEHVMFEGSKNHNRSYFEPLQKAGANLNGSTATDRTNYWEDVPSNYLEMALWLESDRMGFLLDALDQKRFDVQREVVKNERRQTYENRPYGMAQLLLQSAIYPPPHPYNWTPIGSPDHLDAATLEDAKKFFRRHYAPSNASIAIVGDFTVERAKELVDRYFGTIPPAPSPNRIGRMDADISGHVSLSMNDRVQLPRLYLSWPTGPDFGSEQPSLDFLSIILGGGKISRLYNKLVYEKQLAREVEVFQHAQEIAGEFHIQVTANHGHTLEEIEDEVREELERIRREPPTERELARAKNRIESHHVRQLERFGGFGGRADQLNYYNTYVGDPGMINSDIDRYMAVTVDDVQSVANSVVGRNHVRLTVLPERTLHTSAGPIDRSVIPKPSSPAPFQPPVPRSTQLANGLRILLMEKPGLPMVAVGLLLCTGAADDPSNRPGLAHMTASMLSEGTRTRTRGQIVDEMEFVGSYLGSNVGREYVLLSAEALTSKLSTVLEIMADIVKNSIFPPEELERLRREYLTDLGRVTDNPLIIAARASQALLYGPETRYGHPVSGTEQSIGCITRNDLTDHFAAYYGAQTATLIVVGDVSEDEVISNAQVFFGDWGLHVEASSVDTEAASTNPPEPTTIFLADKPGAPQSVIRVGQLTIPRHHRDYYSLNLLNDIFGGQFSARLNMNLRQDKGYSYGYVSSIDWLKECSSLLAGGGVQTEVTKEAIEETLKEFAEILGSRPVTQEEFESARAAIIRGLPAQFETQSQMLQLLSQLVIFDLPLDYYSQYIANVEAVTLDDVRHVAKERIDDNYLKVLVVGDGSKVDAGLRELDLPVVRVDYGGHRLR